MKRKSSIHIAPGKLGYLWHNDRSRRTANSIFPALYNQYSASAEKAAEIYRAELAKRTEAYTARTGRKLHDKTIKHLSAVVNLDDRHRIEDVRKIADYLEQTLGTKVFQIAVHRDEGHVNEETGVKRINYHAHIEFMGLDYQGNSVRRKLTKRYLIDLQSQVAIMLKMERGCNYTAERKKRPKRLDTYEYKEHAKRQAKAVEPLKKELAKAKDLKAENQRIREELKQAHARREHYAELEAEVKELKEKIKAKEVTIEYVRQKMAKKERDLLAQIQKSAQMAQISKEELQGRVRVLEQENVALRAESERLRAQVVEYRGENRSLGGEIERLRDDLSRRPSLIERNAYMTRLAMLTKEFVVPWLAEHRRALPREALAVLTTGKEVQVMEILDIYFQLINKRTEPAPKKEITKSPDEEISTIRKPKP